MKVFIVYCHPSEDSFTRNVRDAFIKGIVDSGNEYVMSDLYKMNFKTDMSEKEYLRDSNYSTEPGLESDLSLWLHGYNVTVTATLNLDCNHFCNRAEK